MWGVLAFTKKVRLEKFSGELKIVDRLPLNATAAVVLVQFRDKEYLMGVGGQNVEILEKL
jgi:flagellar biogenesis protein FliO